ncbi:DUF4190 domain-containing protein [Nocardia macrotermitis]|uniref:DUF4190 domain-containing protein n=1 Tax=Nocardia macrotermitis TaxID=2585198 RepID=A0A7K0DAY6_9NOCA|nr:DUF4190 domain-containing protein [Nocardia macrotermitis]MQY22953.1 hypothetical protein [Nocardia macrotermitis]
MTEYPPPGQYPSPGQGGYPPPPPGDYPAPPGEQRPQGQGRGLAITALVLGILAIISSPTLVGGVLFGLLGLIFGIIAVVKARRGTAGGGAMAWVGLALAALGLIAAIALGVVEGMWIVDHGGRTYWDCAQQANGDQAKVQKCADQFRSSFENTPTPSR